VDALLLWAPPGDHRNGARRPRRDRDRHANFKLMNELD
jgi:hypothetical protein